MGSLAPHIAPQGSASQAEHDARSARIQVIARKLCVAAGGRPDRQGKGHDDDPLWLHFYGEASDIVDREGKG